MKKLLTLVAMFGFAVSFVGCGESAPTKPATPAPAVEKGAAEGEAMPAATEEKPAEGAAKTEEKPAEEAPAEEKKAE